MVPISDTDNLPDVIPLIINDQTDVTICAYVSRVTEACKRFRTNQNIRPEEEVGECGKSHNFCFSSIIVKAIRSRRMNERYIQHA